MVRSQQIPVPVHPGPIDKSLLTRQAEHRSGLIWEGDEEATFRALTFRRCDSAFWMAYPRAHSRVLELIDVAGFGGVSRGAGHLQVDHSLVTALIERWRPETHTFHLPFGEATITLQDIAVLWGLRVDGEPIIGTRFQRSCSQWQDKCEQLLGFRPDASAFSGNRVLKHVLEDKLLADLPDDASDEHFAQRARTFILLLLGGLLFSSHSGRYLPLRYLLHLEDLQISGSLSWGTAVLAHLYRCLCDASLGVNREACGPMILLQIWAWERLPILRPAIQPRDVLPHLAPYAARWDMPHDCHRLPTHVLVSCRDQIDALHGCDQFVWTPYDERAMQSLPQQYLQGSDIWQARVPLICWEIVEEYLPDRVMRQFGMEQLIPEDCDTRADLHDMDSRAGSGTEWSTRHAEHISRWNARRDKIHIGTPSLDVRIPRPDYMDWYLLRTRLLVGNPALRQGWQQGYQSAGSGSIMLTSTVRQAMSLAQGAIPNADPRSRAVFESIRDLCSLTMTAVGSPSSLDMTRSMYSRTAALDRSKRRPRDKIAGRAQPGVRRGGRRRLAERALGAVALVVPDGAAQLVVEPVPVEQDIDAVAEGQMQDRDAVAEEQMQYRDAVAEEQLQYRNAVAAEQMQDRDDIAAEQMVDVDMVEQARTSDTVDSEAQLPVECITQEEPPEQTEELPEQTVEPPEQTVEPPEQTGEPLEQTGEPLEPLGEDELMIPLCSVDGQVEGQPQIPILWPSDGAITLAWVTELMQVFEWGSKAVLPSEFPSLLPVEVFDQLISSATEILHKEPNCLRIDDRLGSMTQVVVVGDVHGQLHDVLFVLREAGYPGDNRCFVFNGDYVDRGAWGLETLLLLLAWKVLLPHRVFLLRGNHESKYCTSVYGFEKEVLVKYGDKGNHVYQRCLECFEGLPLASIIAGRVYTAHGGLFRSIPATSYKRKKIHRVNLETESTSLSLGSLEELAKAKRAVLDPPSEGQNLIPGDVLWSDPSLKPGLSPNKERGIGLLWGPDCTEDFLKKSGLKLIIRSHEGPDARKKRPDLKDMDEGYTIDHVVDSGNLITVFSAPDYPQFQATEDRYRNKGAYIVLGPPDFDTPVFHSFEAVLPRPQVNPYYDYEACSTGSKEELDVKPMVETA